MFKTYHETAIAYFSPLHVTSTNDNGTNHLLNKTADKYERAIQDYLFFRESAAEEVKIMELNRIGVEKNLKAIMHQTARHCGLEMPKQW